MPDFPSKHATGEKMIDCFGVLVTESAGISILQVVPPSPLIGPASIVDGKPQKKITATWSTGFSLKDSP